MSNHEEVEKAPVTGPPNLKQPTNSPTIDVEKRIEIGEEHSAVESNETHKHLVALSIVLTQLVQAIPYGAGLVAGTDIPKAVGASDNMGVWIAASYPLTEATFVLMGGRFGAVHGHKRALVIGACIYVLFHLLTGFMRSIETIILMRVLSGVGGGVMVPNAVALLTIAFPPGMSRNIWVGLFGAMAPVGAAGGTVFPGFFGQLLPWWWLFFFLAITGTVVFGAAAIIVPSEPVSMDPNGKVDYIGAYFGVAGLILFNFSWTQASVVGWSVHYVYALLIVACVHFALFLLWEGKIAKEPILPLEVWSSPSFKPMLLSAFFTYMSVGIALWYITVWEIQVRHYSNFLVAAAFSTFALVGTCACGVSALSVRYLPAQAIMAIGSVSALVANVLIATMPAQQTYWAQVFPALIILGFSPDFLFIAAQIITSNSVRRSYQGIAGSLVGTVQLYGLSTGLGLAGTVERYTNDNGRDQVAGMRNALYFAVGLAGASTLMCLVIRIPKDQRKGWDESDDTAP